MPIPFKPKRLIDRIFGIKQQDDTGKQRLIERMENFKGLIEHPGWKDLAEWMTEQQKTIKKIMAEGVKPDPTRGLSRLEVYDNLQRDYQVFGRVFFYVQNTIKMGEELRLKLAAEAERKQKKDERRQA